MNKKKLFIWLIVVIFGICLIAIIIYILNFYNKKISDDTSDWAIFGDYIGGIVNPLVAIINVLVLIYLTLLVEKNSEVRNKQNILEQKKLFELNLMNKAIEELNEIQHNILSSCLDFENPSVLDIPSWRIKFELWYARNILFFSILRLEDMKILNDIKTIINQVAENKGACPADG